MVMEKKGRKRRRKGLNSTRACVWKAKEGSKIFP